MSETAPDSLATIDPADNSVPSTRFRDAAAVQDFVLRLCRNDENGGQTVSRSFKRSRMNGLIDGNPPYRHSKLLKAGRAEATNVDWGVGRAYMEAAVGPVYDLFAEAAGHMEVTTYEGNPDEQSEWSKAISQEANEILEASEDFDNMMQLSQWQMILHGTGPLLFPDANRVLATPVHAGDLKVPEFTPSNINRWEVAAVLVPYYPTELYNFIRNEKAASSVGWRIGYTKTVIANAANIRDGNGHAYDWEQLQQEFKNNSAAYFDDAKVCWCAHVFWREFSGKVTHAIVPRDTISSVGSNEPVEYLFYHQDQYESFGQCIQPMYYDRGNGGYHHSVTGLGVKMYAALELRNRLLCKMADDAFLPKTMFAPTTPSATQKFTLTPFGSWALIPAGFTPQQVQVAGVVGDELALDQKLSGILDSNLSAYRQQITPKEGNPVTARQVMYDASQQSALGKTQINRYYKQLDMLYGEIYRRMAKPNNPDPLAVKFRECCKKRNIPTGALTNVKSVRAIRIVGQGNNFMRQDVLERAWLQYGPALPEEGRSQLLTDGLASGMGYLQARRYNPTPANGSLPDDQTAEATQWVASMKVGVPPVVTRAQNPVIYATVFLQSAMAAVQSLQQGANPTEVYRYLTIVGPAIMAYLQRFPRDPARQQLGKALAAKVKELASIADDLGKQIQEGMQSQAEQQQKTAEVLNDQQLKQLKAQSDIQIKQVKTAKQLEQSQQKHEQRMREAQQDMVLKDAATASDIQRANATAAADKRRSDFTELEQPPI